MSATCDSSGDESHISRIAVKALSNLERRPPRRRAELSPNQDRRPPWSGRIRSPSPVISILDRSPTPPLHARDLRHSIPRETRDRSPRHCIGPMPDFSRRVQSRSGHAVVSPVWAPASAAPPAMMGDLLRELDGMREDIAVLSRRSDNAG